MNLGACQCFPSQSSAAPFWYAVIQAGSPQLCPNQPLPRADAGRPQCLQLTSQAPSLILDDGHVFILSLCWHLPPGIRRVSQFFCLWKLGRSTRGLLPLGLQLHCRGGCTGLPDADPSVSRGPAQVLGAQHSCLSLSHQLSWPELLPVMLSLRLSLGRLAPTLLP